MQSQRNLQVVETPNCATGFFQTKENTCEPCMHKFKNCEECDRSSCQLCDFGFEFNEQGECHQPLCQIEGCNRCSEDYSECLDCEDSLTHVNGKCELICEPDEFMSDNQCKKCSERVPNCDRCNMSEQGFSCHKCQGDLTFLIVDDQLECGCDFVSFIDSSTPEPLCKVCSSKIDGCASCSNNGESCLHCKSGMFLTEKGECSRDPCSERNSLGECVSCNQQSEIEMLLYKDTCVSSCPKGSFQNFGKCEPLCSQGQVSLEKSCQDCKTQNCLDCESEYSCQKCLPGKNCDLTCSGEKPVHDYTLGACVRECP